MDVGLDRVVVDRAGGVDAGLEDQVGEGEDDCRVLVWEAGLGSSWSPRGPGRQPQAERRWCSRSRTLQRWKSPSS